MSLIQQRKLRSGEDSGLDYLRTNKIEEVAAGARNEASQLRYAGGRTMIGRQGFFPFRIYQLPQQYRDLEADQTSDWRTFIIRSGYVLTGDATGTDGIANPYSDIFPTNSDNEIVVPEGNVKHWFWLEINENEDGLFSSVVRYGPDPTADSYDDGFFSWDTENPWTGFPRPDGGHVPIGWVDTQTNKGIFDAPIRQLLTTDIIFSGSECY